MATSISHLLSFNLIQHILEVLSATHLEAVGVEFIEIKVFVVAKSVVKCSGSHLSSHQLVKVEHVLGRITDRLGAHGLIERLASDNLGKFHEESTVGQGVEDIEHISLEKSHFAACIKEAVSLNSRIFEPLACFVLVYPDGMALGGVIEPDLAVTLV